MKQHAALIITALVLSISCGAEGHSRSQSNGLVTTALDSLKLPNDKAFLAKLLTNMELRQCKVGDPVEAEPRQDVKQGHDVLLKKNATLLGHVSAVELPSSDKPQLIVGIVFDTVRMKDGKQFSLNLIIQALAPEADVDTSGSLADRTGTGMASATRTAGVGGHSSTVMGNVNQLTPESKGVYDLQGVVLGEHISNGAHSSVLATSLGDFRLKKGTQLILRVWNP